MFRPEAATAMAAYFLMRAPNHRLNDLFLMKLMVISERQSMRITTSLISGDNFYSMQNGPVLSEVLDLIKKRRPSAFWNQHIGFIPYSGDDTQSNTCFLKQSLEVEDYLSEFQIDLLNAVWNKYKNKNKWDLVNLTHTFPEWDMRCARTRSSTPILLKSIFQQGFKEDPVVATERANEIEYFEAVTD